MSDCSDLSAVVLVTSVRRVAEMGVTAIQRWRPLRRDTISLLRKAHVKNPGQSKGGGAKVKDGQVKSGAGATGIGRLGSANSGLGLVVLGLAAIFAYIDRTILSVLQVPIKAELGVTDSQLGVLTGLAFALFYTGLAMPIARIADRTTRKSVIAISLLLWSLMTATTGLANGFTALLVFRVGVAIGEAGCVPATHSMISDLFPRDRRATALSLWGLSYPIGTMLGLAGGGWLATQLGWRNAFFWIGVSGMVIAPIILFGIREPQRGRREPAGAAASPPRLRDAIAILWNLRCFRYVVAAGAFNSYVQSAVMSWNAPFYYRAFGMPLAHVALWLAVMSGVGGGIGIFLGGNLSDWFGRRFTRGYLLLPAVGMAASAPLIVIQYQFASAIVSLLIGVAIAMCLTFYFASSVAVSHALVPPRMRAFTSATISLITNLVGVGLGPLVTGMMSDAVGSTANGASLRLALTTTAVPALLAGWLFWKAAKWLEVELPTTPSDVAQLAH